MTLGLSLADAERITMPEYLALSHFHNQAHNDDDAEPDIPQPGDVTEMFLRAERAGLAKVH